MDSREQARTERRGGLLSRLRPGAEEGQARDGLEPVLRTLRSYNAKADTKEIERAYRFAEAHHAGQKRLSGGDFIEHPLSVAQMLAELGLDTTTLTAALLHDVVEDTEVTLEDLERGHIMQTLQHTGGNRTRAARLLGIGKTTLYRKLKEYAQP